MANFAELDENNVVLRVIVVGDADTCDENGVEKEHIGASFCEKILGGRWKQTSVHGNIRKRYAGIGYTYNEELDAFIAPKIYPTWILDNETADWIPPIPMPVEEGKVFLWDESTQSWVETTGVDE